MRTEPADAAVVVGRAGDGCAACACPHINLFTSTAAAERYLSASGLCGTIADVPGAMAAGQRAFGDLLERIGPGPGR